MLLDLIRERERERERWLSTIHVHLVADESYSWDVVWLTLGFTSLIKTAQCKSEVVMGRV